MQKVWRVSNPTQFTLWRLNLSWECFIEKGGPPTRGVLFQGEIIYTPPPPPPHFWLKGIFEGRGWGCIFWGPTRQEFYNPPPFYAPPTPRRVFSGVGGVGVYKIWPRNFGIPTGGTEHGGMRHLCGNIVCTTRSVFTPMCVYRNHRKGGTASLRSRTCANRTWCAVPVLRVFLWILGSDFGRTILCHFLDAQCFRGFCRWILSPHFVEKSAQKNPPGKSPAKSSKTYTTKIPTTFCRGAGPIFSLIKRESDK